MRRTLLSLITVSCVTLASTFTLPVIADEFSDVYGAFQNAVGVSDYEKALKLAERAYHLGAQKFGDNSANTEALIFNYANMLVANNNYKDAISVYMEVERRYEKRYGADSPEMYSLYMDIIGAMNQLDRKTADLFQKEHIVYLRKVIIRMPTILEEMADKQLAGELFYQGAISIAETSGVPAYRSSIVDYMNTAIQFMTEHMDAKDARLLEVSFIQGEVMMMADEPQKAIAQFEQIIEELEQRNKPNHPYVLSSHARLVKLFEDADNAEAATRHCVAIGKMKPWQDSQDPEPIYRIEPDYPHNYSKLQKEGYAVVNFDIDTEGFVKNAVVEESDGGQLFGEAAKNAIEQWRYAPKFENGETVAATGLSTRIDFYIRRVRPIY